MIIAWLAFFDSLLAVAMLGAGVVGAHWRWVTPILGLSIFLLGTLVGIFALLLGLLGIFLTRTPARARLVPCGHRHRHRGDHHLAGPFDYPDQPQGLAINDITTDFDNPPEFANAQQLNANRGRDMKYDKAKYADRQLQGYGALAPLKMTQSPDDAFKMVQQAASQMPTWTITVTRSGDPHHRGVRDLEPVPFQ